MEGNKIIEIARTKTGSLSRIHLLEIPLFLIENYASHDTCLRKNRILPVYSNQKMNAYLKEIGDLCGIKKWMTSHLARHTYATLCLTEGVDIVAVSSIFGHKNLKQTQHYAKMTTGKLNEEMNQASVRLSISNYT
jgi:site-specific recombinase XerD